MAFRVKSLPCQCLHNTRIPCTTKKAPLYQVLLHNGTSTHSQLVTSANISRFFIFHRSTCWQNINRIRFLTFVRFFICRKL